MIEISNFEEVTQIRMSRVIDGNPVYWVAAYLVDGILIDSGSDYTAQEFVSFLEDKDVRVLVNTHFHEDHIGGNSTVKARFNIDILAHKDSIPHIRERPKLNPYQEIVWNYPVPTDASPLPPKISSKNYNFEPIETPGHSIGHVVLLERNRGWCFSGDIFARENPKCIRTEENMSETVQSMERIIELKGDRLILFTSVGKIIEDGEKSLQACIGYLKDLSKRAKTLNEKGLDVKYIVNELFGGEHSFAELTGGHYSTENLIRSVLQMD